ncbi:C40 family peptidase [Georgenia muralis]|nr:C40 family peptidase [Georgenia muralis]
MTPQGARHRAARRPSTPLTVALSGQGARRGIAAVASSGLILTMAATSASAAPQTSALPNVDISAATSEALTAMVTTPTVTVPADITWSADVVASAEATPPPPPPEPEPEPEPVVERDTAAASRTAERTAIEAPAARTAAPAPAEAAPTPAPAPVAAASGVGQQIVNIARQYVGVPYVWGGATPAGFDCSGFIQYVFAQVGISLPRTSSAQGSVGYRVSAAEARPGDIIWGPGHSGIYTGNGQHIAARNPGTALYESPIYMSNPVFIRVTG